MHKFLALNIPAVAIFLAAWLHGWTSRPFYEDQSGLSFFILLVAFVGLGAASAERWRTVRWIENVLIMLGLVGTVIGFIIAFSGVNPEEAKNVEAVTPMVAALIKGMSTALYTTLIGACGFLWLSFNHHLFCSSEEL